MGSRRVLLDRNCPACGAQFRPHRQSTTFCSRACAKKHQDVQGPANWKGGRNAHINGYIRLYLPSHPFAAAGGYIFEHRVVMEQHIGRYLMPNERVHHKNGVRDDNRVENLELWQIGRKDPAGQRVEDLLREMIHKHPELAAKVLKERDPNA